MYKMQNDSNLLALTFKIIKHSLNHKTQLATLPSEELFDWLKIKISLKNTYFFQNSENTTSLSM